MHFNHISWPLVSFALCASLFLTPAASWGVEAVASAAPGELEVIIVTARRRNEPLMAVPMSVTHLDGATLEALQYHDIRDILGLSPGVLVYDGGDGVSSQITIRGVVTPGALVEPGNAVYVDEIYSSGMRTLLPGFYDIASVQVLKGPQAGLYGRNTMGGAVLVTTGQPTEEISAHLDTSYAQYGSKVANGTVNVPLTDSVRLRSTLWYNDRDGGYYQSQILDKNIDASRERGGRLTFGLEPNERTAITLTGDYDEIKSIGLRGSGGLVEGAQLGPPPLPPESRHNVLRDDLDGFEQDISGVNGKLDFDTTAGSFVALAGWRRASIHLPESDWDGTAYVTSLTDFLAYPFFTSAPQALIFEDRDRNLNAEVRFLTPDNGAPLRAQTGVSYFEETTRLFAQIAPVREFAQLLEAVGKDGDATRRANQVTTSWAGFTELIWTPMASIEVTTDLRYTHDEKEIDMVLAASGYYSDPRAASVTFDESDNFKNWSPGITVAYQPDDSLMVFGKYVRGFRAGGFNGLVYDPELVTYDSEEGENYELGLKAQLFDRRLELGASVFYLRINDALFPVFDPGTFLDLFPLQNLAIVETTGLEIDLLAQVTDRLSLSASGGVYHRTFSNYGPSFLKARPFTPDHTASLVANYERPLTPALTGLATLGFRYRGGGTIPGGSDIGIDAYHLLDGQLGIRFEQMEFTGFVRNALDENYVTSNFAPTGGQSRYLGASAQPYRALIRDPGRVLGVRFSMDF